MKPLIPTYADFVAKLPAAQQLEPFEACLARYTNHVDSEVYALAEVCKRQYPDRTSAEIRSMVADILTATIVSSHLGQHWYEQNFTMGKVNDQTRGYLYPTHELPNVDQYLRTYTSHRKHELARRLHQLQTFDWFPSTIEHVRTTQLSGAAFELDVATYLMALPLRVDRVSETGIKGEDFDLLFWVRETPIAIEAKTKEDNTEFSEQTIKQTIKRAGSQLPKGQTGFVFMRIPMPWVGPLLEEHYNEYLHSATRSSTRISVVFTAIDKLGRNADGTTSITRFWDYFKTENCPEQDWKIAMNFRSLHDGEFLEMAPRLPF
ncbi:hypothetical protein FFI94_018795 [Rhodococcus sp. KBS0724]|uniref:hypothetical protein n=1 Tax=Rhodococcus sp. KBS0724 TaxID=1179674 RepID=UPI00110E9805|nr:hypothetical protein [Rhodococcus sp. KBS0724]TSD47965.1 hypothetical protein FFI94_018795 [Rhodococcus sp. KBS0724]